MVDGSDFQLQNSAKAIEFARDSIRSGIIINGGAAVAVLALLSGQNAAVPIKVGFVKAALVVFAIGVLAAFSTGVAGYLAQTFYAMHNARQLATDCRAVRMTYLALALIGICGACFISGIVLSAMGLANRG